MKFDAKIRKIGCFIEKAPKKGQKFNFKYLLNDSMDFHNSSTKTFALSQRIKLNKKINEIQKNIQK